jgi:peptidoglycan/LPS O-acetylase OafA/YrhL
MNNIKQHVFYFPNLDALRFIAFLFVFMAHTYQKVVDMYVFNNFLLTNIIHFFFCSGDIGVSIFFVLSGFLITYGIFSEIKQNGKFNLRNFFIKRTFRIWPLYFLLILFGFVIYPLFKIYLFHLSYYTCANPWNYVLFLSNFDMIYVSKNCLFYGVSFQGITWSVSIEEQFYLVWPFIFFLTPIKYYKYAIGFVLLVSVFFRIINIDDYVVLYYHTLSVIGDLAIGSLVAYLAFYSDKFIPFINNLKTAYIYIIYILGLAILILIHDQKYFLSPVITRLYSITYFALIIAIQNFHVNAPLSLSKLKIFSKWGKYTYGLYLFHFVVYYLVELFFKKIKLKISPISYHLLLSTLTFVLSMLLCYLLYEYFEKYFLNMRRKFLS